MGRERSPNGVPIDQRCQALRAVVVTPGRARTVRIIDAPEPNPTGKQALLRVQKIGIDGTDLEINEGLYGEAPSGFDYLVCGHECLATVEKVPANSADIQSGDLVVPTVRRPDDCINCHACESDI